VEEKGCIMADSEKKKKHTPPPGWKPYYVDPREIITVAASVSLLIANNMKTCQITTLVNFLNVLSSNLASIVGQRRINEGEKIYIPPEGEID
jgi:hypothetical protein